MYNKPVLPNCYSWEGDFIVVRSEGTNGEITSHVVGAIYNTDLFGQLVMDYFDWIKRDGPRVVGQ